MTTATRPRNAHPLIVYGKGAHLWGQCACEEPGRGRVWCWAGTYTPARGRLATLRAKHAEHVARVARLGSECPPIDTDY